MDELIGSTMGPYKILARIGEGGMGVVYKGYQESLHRYVAVKVLRSRLALDAQFISRFRREARAVARLSHPNILHVYDAGMIDGRYYMAMDYVEGGSLKDLLKQGPLGAQRALSIASQVADALEHAHQHKLIHRDVKPGNILLSRDGRPLLTDFGIARALDASTRLTSTGASIGTPEYMAPEQALAQPADGRTDIYALGIVLYEMLTGHVPFHTDTPMATLYKQVHEPLPPLRRSDGHVPAWLAKVVDRALAKRLEDRYQTASELAEALRRREAPSPQRALGQPSRTPAPARTQTNRRLVPILAGFIALLLLVLIAAGAYLAWRGTANERATLDAGPVVTLVVTPQPAVTRVVTSVQADTAIPLLSVEPTLMPTAVAANTTRPSATLFPTAGAVEATATPSAVVATMAATATTVPSATAATSAAASTTATKAAAPTKGSQATCPPWYEKPQQGRGILLVENHIGEGLQVEQIEGGSGQWSVAAKQGDIPGRLLLQLPPGDHQFVLYVPPRGRGGIKLHMEAGQQFVSPIWYNDRSEDYVYPLETPAGCN